MANTCVFCGSGRLTSEHVFGEWVSEIGLDLSPVQHLAGPLNALPRPMGHQPPFRQKVKDVCGTCNSGWMSRLETVAQRVLTPHILGTPGTIGPDDHSAVTRWVQKTALTAMLLSSEEQRAGGYGLPASMYMDFYDRSDLVEPLPASRFWVGRYERRPDTKSVQPGGSSVRVTPLAIRLTGVEESDRPHAYAMTVVLGELVVHGVVFLDPALEVELITDLGMPQLWPSVAAVVWPAGRPCDEASYLRFADGKTLRSSVEHVQVRPWTPATGLPDSVAVNGERIEVPALCRKHVIHYPTTVLLEALQGAFYAFTAVCECPESYLLHTQSDSVNFKAAGASDGIAAMYDDLVGEEVVFDHSDGPFVCKRLPT